MTEERLKVIEGKQQRLKEAVDQLAVVAGERTMFGKEGELKITINGYDVTQLFDWAERTRMKDNAVAGLESYVRELREEWEAL